MKRIKFIVSFIVMLLGFLIIGESYQLYLNNFNTVYSSTTLYVQDYEKIEMIEDVLESAKRNKVEVFAQNSDVVSTYLKEITIYGSKGVEKHINEELGIFEKEYKSLLLGKTKITFADLDDIPNIENVHDFHVIGRKENVHQFKMDLIDKYAGNHPIDGYPNRESARNTFVIWLLIDIVILFLSFYDVILQKKENFIKISLGERVSTIIWKNILLDSFVFGGIFVLSFWMLSHYNHVDFQFYISLGMFIAMLTLNASFYIKLNFYHLREVFSNTKFSKKLLSLNYVLKLITVILTILLISSNIAIMFESYSLYKQRPFFEKYADYYYTNLGYKPIIHSDGTAEDYSEEDAIMRETFYRQYFEKFDATTLVNISYDSERTTTIIANRNAKDYLLNEIEELKNEELNKEIYFLIPKNMSKDKSIIDSLNLRVKDFEGEGFKYDYSVIYYQKDIEIIGIDEFTLNRSELVENPIIIYNNIKANKSNYPIHTVGHKSIYQNDIMYKISDIEFKSFLEENDMVGHYTSRTNVLENYEYNWNISKRILYMNGILSVLVIFLEIIIIHFILRLEFEVNAIELSIKKILGYSTLQNHRKILLMTIGSTILSITISILVGLITNIEQIYYLAVGGSVVLTIEVVIIIYLIKIVEASNVQKILKGGSL